jgi:hypothetical protein
MLMHASLTCSVIILGASAASGTQMLINDVALASALWAVVAGFAFANRWRLSTAPPVRRAA